MKQYTAPGRISSIETTRDTLTGRGGVALFARYLSGIGLRAHLEGRFGFIRKSVKGLDVWSLFVQVLCWLFDGTSPHVSYFDELARDAGYASLLDHDVKRLASSHTIKRFFKGSAGGVVRVAIAAKPSPGGGTGDRHDGAGQR